MRLYHYMILGLLVSGCSKQLNVYPTTQEVDGNIITDEKSATTALNGVYYMLANAGKDYNGTPNSSWYSLQEETASQLSGLLDYSYGGGGLSEHTYDAKNYSIQFHWTYGYGLVNAANGFLKNIQPFSGMAAAVKTRMIAEAKFARAYGNADLLLYYGQYDDVSSPYGIILHDDFIQPENIYQARATVAESYTAIFKDLDEAIADLPAKNSSIAYANSWAAKLLKARLLMVRGSQGDHDAVVSLTKDIIANGPFVLEGNVKDIFWTKGLSSPEVMLGIQPFERSTSKWQSYISYVDYGPNDFMRSLFEDDPRASWYMQTVNAPYDVLPAVTKYYPGSATTIAATPITEVCYVFRLTEAYLLEAEAIVAGGGDLEEARGLLKTVLTHAGYTDLSVVDAAATAEALQKLIIIEEVRNFACENGQDWLAIRRLPFATLQDMLPTIVDKHLLVLPIPDAEIISNKAVKQNPQY